MAEMENKALDWDDDVEDVANEYILLDEGNYAFTVDSYARERYEGSAKVPPCPRANVSLVIDLPDGRSAKISDRILLYTGGQWRISQFFKCLGFQKDPETDKITPKWNEAPGKSGIVNIKQRTYTNNDGEERTTNDVSRYLSPEECTDEVWNNLMNAPKAAAQAQPQAQQSNLWGL